MAKTLVIGATGTVGRQVVSQLIEADERVRAMVRRPEAAGLPAEAEVAGGDLTVPDSLNTALEGIERVFVVWQAPGTAAEEIVGRIGRQARRIVLLAGPHKTPHPLFQQPNPVQVLHARLERLIEGTGVEWTFVRPGMFAANSIGWWAPQIRVGNVVRWPYPDVPTAPIDERDIAAVAVRALLDDGHTGRDYVITGPDALTHAEQVATIGRAIGRELRLQGTSREEARIELLSVLGNAAVIEMLMNAWAAADGHPAYMTNTVEEVTGRKARSFEDWARDHAGEFLATDRGSR